MRFNGWMGLCFHGWYSANTFWLSSIKVMGAVAAWGEAWALAQVLASVKVLL